MEAVLRQGREALDRLSAALEDYAALRPGLRALDAYYGGEDWRRDLALDEAGQLPADLPRGVLSEDGIYNLLTDERELLGEMRQLLEECARED